jgi:hypothetical protein
MSGTIFVGPQPVEVRIRDHEHASLRPRQKPVELRGENIMGTTLHVQRPDDGIDTVGVDTT